MVAVYNKADYLDKCFESLSNQTLKDIEIIVVDDGSTDGSAEICDNWARRDNRIRVIHQKNGGVALARKNALALAKGNYLVNCDPDDWVDLDTYAHAIATAQEHNADIVIFDLMREYPDGTSKDSCLHFSGLATDDAFETILRQRNFSTCNKIISADIVKNNGITYSQGVNIGEDFLFLAKVFLTKPHKVVKIDRPFYHYRFTPGNSSLTQKVSEASLITHIRVYRWRLKNMTEPWMHKYNSAAALGIVYLMLRCEECSNEFRRLIINEFATISNMITAGTSYKVIIAAMAKVFGPTLTRKVIKFIH